MKVSVDADLCAGHGACTETCPEIFAIGDEGYAVIVVDEIPGELDELVLRAAEECPTQAILIEPA